MDYFIFQGRNSVLLSEAKHVIKSIVQIIPCSITWYTSAVLNKLKIARVANCVEIMGSHVSSNKRILKH